MNRRALSVFIGVSMLVSGAMAPAFAQTSTSTISDLQALVDSLKAQIDALKARIDVLKAKDIRGTVKLIRQLSIGATGDDVTALQELLATDFEIYPEGLVTGYFGPLTRAAVRRFQKRHGIEQVGEVGPKTRGKIYSLLSVGGFKTPPGLAKKLGVVEGGSGTTTDPAPTVAASKIVLCHRPPGNSLKVKTLTVGSPALNAHLAHGDAVGACGGEPLGDDDDVIAPVISGLTATSTTASATDIMWTTDEDATSKVWYGMATPVPVASTTLMVSSASLVTDHNLALSSLSASTTYYYIATSVDEAGNAATSSEETFTTQTE